MKKPHLTPDQFSHEDLKKSLEKKDCELEELKGELEIEAALERVRIRTMAMHKSEELSDSATVLFKQLRGLGGNLWSAGFVLLDEKNEVGEFRMSNPEGEIQLPIFIPNTIDPATKNMYIHWKNGADYYFEEAGGKDLKKHYDYLLDLPEARPAFQALLDAGIAFPTWQQWHAVYFSGGYLLVITLEPFENINMLRRFANVFEQTYTRFLDLQKAEAQAREAQIELALEKVRARTMAMHHSSELAETTEVLYQQLIDLGIGADRILIGFPDEAKRSLEFWMTPQGGGADETKFTISLDEPSVIAKTFAEWKSKKKFVEIVLTGKALKSYLSYINKALNISVSMPLDAHKRVYSNANFSSGFIQAISSSHLLAEDIKLLERFAAVFDLIYTRFLDLQKAEAQAREAQIEAALEKVRSRSMGMQKSEESSEVIQLINQQLIQLNFTISNSGFGMDYRENEDYNLWMADAYTDFPKRVHIPYIDHPQMKRAKEAREKGLEFLAHTLTFEEKNQWFKYVFENVFEVTNETKEAVYGSPGLATSVVLMKNVFLYLLNYDGTPYSDSENDILKRFGKVFEQTYTRFLDLQKAEAQAREAQIEAALERVRSRSMAMHKSDELAETAKVLFTQFDLLGIIPDRINIAIFREDKKAFELWATDQTGSNVDRGFDFSIEETTYVAKIYAAWKQKKETFIVDLSGKDLADWVRFVKEDTKMKIDESQFKGRRVQHCAFFSQGFLLLSSHLPIEDHMMQLLLRFAKVFQQTYTRFLDLQKAEAQARESQIEAALERIRAKALAMQSSDDLHDVSMVLREQMGILGQPELESSIVHLYNHSTSLESWYTFKSKETNSTKIVTDRAIIPVDSCDYIKETIEKYNSKESEYTIVSKGKKLADWYNVMVKVAPDTIEYDDKGKILIPEILYYHHSKFSGGALLMISNQPPAEESKELQRRAAHVFNFAFQRFLDLKKAEAQAREAQIEAALERVRAQTMAMHNSEDVGKCIVNMFGELTALGVYEGTRFGIGILNQENQNNQLWTASKDGEEVKMHIGKLDMTSHPLLKSARKAWKAQVPLHKYVLEGEDLLNYYQMINSAPDYRFRIAIEKLPEREIHYGFIFDQGFFYAFSPHEFKPDLIHIIQRFSSLFGQTYRRYLDLVKAEAQAKEAQIEAALERVRSRSLAMHKSDELREVVNTLHNEFRSLNINFDVAIIQLLMGDPRDLYLWVGTSDGLYDNLIYWPYVDIRIRNVMHQARLSKETFEVVLTRAETSEFFEEYFKIEGTPQGRKAVTASVELIDMIGYYQANTCIALMRYTEGLYSEEEKMITERFSKVFEQTYTRFLDLQKAEGQAREAQIEAALERVRSKTMAMHDSQDVGETVAVMFDELTKLGIEKSIRCGIVIIDETKLMEVWNASYDSNGKIVLVIGRLDMNLHPALQGVYRAWETKQPTFSYEFIGQDLKNYFHAIANYPDYPLQVDMNRLPSMYYNNDFYFAEGAIFTFTLDPISPEMSKIIKRFAGVFGQTYRRYLDLRKAEAQARESIKQASLDRIRGEIASMRTTSDLDRITPLIWSELTIQGIPFIRCGVFIMDEEKKIIHNYLSLPDGKAIAAFQLPYATPGAVSNILQNWQERKIFLDHWDDVAMKEFADILVHQRILHSPDQYLSTLPKGGFYLHFLPFNQGMLYVGNTMQLNEDEVNLIQSLANTFSTAYARYEDFNKLEIAKKQVDEALVDLKQAQQQLVQAEKMASLGELTAGIAHEIQNPLNFVNNFSEVNTELIEELKAERQKATGERDEGLEDELLADLSQNTEKIHHHGKRASGIVKGMLEHSRTGTSEKQLTDINALADEYLRLAYHGLRAKDKSFNAEFITDLDPSMPKVNVITQDIGRVLLNLINNAFYAVSEKSKKDDSAFQPKVTVITKRKDNLVEIKVKDNANGIPVHIVNKIFQPFFTTKPTGSGTGLGLSLSYDIITMGHNGTLEVDTAEGLGSEFIIQLPIV